MMEQERRVRTVVEAIDRTILDPTQWPGVLDAICSVFPGTKATIHLADTHDLSSLGILHRGFESGQIAAYEQHYALINPWMPFLVSAPEMRALVADERCPSSSFRETEFYRDWLVRVGDMESAIGLKLVHEPDRVGVLAVHYAPARAERYNPEIGHLVQRCAVRLRRAVDALRLAREPGAGAAPGSAAPMQIGTFALPALLLDDRGRVLDLNQPAQRLLESRLLSLGLDHTLRLAGAGLAERVAAAARQIASGRGPCSQGIDLPLFTREGKRLTLSLLPVRVPPPPGVPAFFSPLRLALMLVRPGGSGAPQVQPQRRLDLTPAEWRLAVQLASGLSLRQSAARLGISYNTARTQLKAVFEKTGVSRQGELVALLARMTDVE